MSDFCFLVFWFFGFLVFWFFGFGCHVVVSRHFGDLTWRGIEIHFGIPNQKIKTFHDRMESREPL